MYFCSKMLMHVSLVMMLSPHYIIVTSLYISIDTPAMNNNLISITIYSLIYLSIILHHLVWASNWAHDDHDDRPASCAENLRLIALLWCRLLQKWWILLPVQSPLKASLTKCSRAVQIDNLHHCQVSTVRSYSCMLHAVFVLSIV